MRDDERALGHPPGDEGPPLINLNPEFLVDAPALDARLERRFGPLFRSRTLGRTWVCVASPELAGAVLLDRERCFSSREGWEDLVGPLFRRGLMLRDFDDHQRHRRIMQTAFREPARRAYHGLLVREIDRTLGAWAPHRRLRFFPAVKQALLGQAATVFLGLPLGARAQRLAEAFRRLLDAIVTVLRVPLPGTAWRRGLAARAWITELLEAELPRRRGGDGSDLFTLLANARDPSGDRFADDEVIDHMIFIMVAAHDTTTTALTTLVEHLAGDSRWQMRLRAECRGLGLAAAALSFDHLDALEEVDWAFCEALRINPPVPYIARRTIRGCPLGGHALPARTPISVNVRGPHQNPAIWSEPQRFDPERFSRARAEDRRHPHAWIPFGGGAHRCIGAEFARQQAKLFLAMMLLRFEFKAPPGRRARWRHIPIPRPRDGLPLDLRPLGAGPRAGRAPLV